MDEIKPDTRKVIKISRKKFVVVTIIVVIVLIFLGILSLSKSRTIYTEMGNAPSVSSLSENLDRSKSAEMMPNYYDGGYGQPSVTDTREFLKTSYSATIKTRDVSGVVKDVKNVIKGSDGRIDNFYSSEKRGQISFVVPKSKFDAFRDEIEAITHSKLYSENISSQNLLSQKQSIEEQTNSIVKTLGDLNKEKETIATKHNQIISPINNELSRIQTELITIRANISNTSDSSAILALRNQETILINEDTVQRQKLSTENSNYLAQKQNLEYLIANYNESLTSVNKQDSQFTDNIETVNGSINVNWVSLWEITKIFSPIHPVIIIIILIFLIWICLKRRGYIPRIEWL